MLYDSPKVVLPAAFRSVNRVYESGDFKTYLMYKPAGTNSIWVTIQSMTWHWSGEADWKKTGFLSSGWVAKAGKVPPLVNPKAAKDATLPTWNNYWTLANAGPLSERKHNQRQGDPLRLGNPLVGVTVTARWSSGATLLAHIGR